MRKACIAFLCLSALAFGQAALAPIPKLQFFDATGKPLAGGLVWTYISGTQTPLATYTDATATVPNQNPIVLDAGGYASIWLANTAYTFAVQKSDGTPLYTTDNIVAGGSAGSGAGTVTSLPNGVLLGTKTKLSDDAAIGQGILLACNLANTCNGVGGLGDATNDWLQVYADHLVADIDATIPVLTVSTSAAIGGGVAVTNSSKIIQNVGVYTTTASPATFTIPSSFGITASSYCDVFPMDTTAAAYTSTSVTPGTNSVTFTYTGTSGHPVRFSCSAL